MFPPPSVRISSRRLPSSLPRFSLNCPRPTTSNLPSWIAYSLPRCSRTVSSSSSPAPAPVDRSFEGSPASGVGSAGVAIPDAAPDAGALASGVPPNENGVALVDVPKANGLEVEDPKAPPDGALGPALSPLSAAPKAKPVDGELDAPKENPCEALGVAVLVAGFAPPNESWGVVPSGPNLPSLGGGSDGLVVEADGVNVLDAGVVGCRAPDGAKENRPDDLDPDPKLNLGASASLASLVLEPVMSSSSPSTSSTILLTELGCLVAMAAGAEVGVTDLAVSVDTAVRGAGAAGAAGFGAALVACVDSSTDCGGGCQPAFPAA